MAIVDLVGITVFIGLLIAQFSLQSPDAAVDASLPLFVLGMAMSTAVTAMNTVTLANLTDDNASSGNGLLAVTSSFQLVLGWPSALRCYASMKVLIMQARYSGFTTPL